uniref:Uncharacterized protein n=1 Tax=Rhizophora mucronata TaxID=61149 RepID=A0A2P2LC88_RHIMU
MFPSVKMMHLGSACKRRQVSLCNHKRLTKTTTLSSALISRITSLDFYHVFAF